MARANLHEPTESSQPRHKTATLSRYLSWLIWLSVFPLLILATCLAVGHIQTLQTQLAQGAQDRVGNIMNAIDRQLEEQISALQMLAASPLIDDPPNLEDFYKQCQAFRESFGGHVILADLATQMIFNTRVPLGESLPKLPKPRGHAAAPAVMETGKPAVGDMFMGPIAKEPLVAVVVPVIRDEKNRFLLLSIVETLQFQQRLEQMFLPLGWYVTLLDGKEELMARRNLLEGEHPPIENDSPLRFVAKSAVSHWSTVVEVPWTVRRKPIVSTAAALAIALLAATGLSVAGGRFASRRLGNSVKGLMMDPSGKSSGPIIAEIEDARKALSETDAARREAILFLQESEHRYRDLWEEAPVMMISLDSSATINFASDFFCQELGYDRSEILGKKPFEFQTKDSAQYAESEIFPTFLKTGMVRDAFLQLVRKNGEVIDVILNVSAERDSQGKIVRSRSVFIDVTEQNRAQRAILESQARYADLYENAPDMYVSVNAETARIIRCNNTMARVTGYSKDEIIGRLVWEMYQPGVIEDVKKVFQSFRATGAVHNAELQLRCKDESKRDVMLNASAVYDESGKIMHSRSILRDITEIKAVQLQLEESEERYRQLVEASPLAIGVHCDGRVVFANPAGLRLFGAERFDQLAGKPITEIVHPDGWEKAKARIQRMMAGEKGLYPTEDVYLKLDGTPINVEVMAAPLTYEGKPAVQVIVTDLTARKKLESSRRRLVTAIHQSHEAIIITDPHGIIEYVNPSLERISGYSQEDLLGNKPSIFKSGEHGTLFYKQLWETISSGKTWSGRFTNRRKDGNLYYEDVTISPVTDDYGTIVNYVGVKRDVTEHLELTKQLLQAQKMEAVGTLAGGIAHDFNNILQVVCGYSEILLAEKKQSDPQSESLEKILVAGHRGSELVRNLLTFSRKVEPKLRPVDINHEVIQFQKLLSRTIPKIIGIDLNLGKDLETIMADPSQIGQILMNLGVNSRDAMPQGGTLTIATAMATLDQTYCANHLGMKPGRYVLLRVSDSGVGMDKETVVRIFDPFFTTKEAGKGTGLGLAMVYGIVRQHQGHITCNSELGVGTTFDIYFPVVELERTRESSTNEVPIKGGSETILLVDDEDVVRDIASKMLTEYGYKVISACDGKEALAVHQAGRESISLIILDLIMPEMDGRACLKELLKLAPEAKVLIASGYSDAETLHDVKGLGARGFIEKPFYTEVLLHTVREVLDVG